MQKFKQFNEQKTKPRSAKGAVYETDVYGAKGYHSKCLEPNCEWKSKNYNKINNAQEAIKKHHREEHFKND